jgi:hypothetical protein
MSSLQSLIEGCKLTPQQEVRVASFVKQVCMDEDLTPRVKASYIGTPAVFALEQCCQQLWDAFCCNESIGYCGGIYLVGSAMARADWRDVDIRIILNDDEFQKLFPNVCNITTPYWESDPRWLMMTVSIAEWMRRVTGLPIDFQFQPQTFANKHHPGKRNAMGLRISGKKASE